MGNGQPIPPQMPTHAGLECADCHEQLMVRIPKPVIINAPQCSAIIFAHEVPDTCPKCGSMYLIKINGIGPALELQVNWIKLQTNRSAILPGDDETLKSTLALNELGKKAKEN